MSLFDCALHFRFLQKATEAMFEMGQASVAAAIACQKRAFEDLSPPPPAPEPQPDPMMWWFNAWFPAATPKPPPPQPDLMQSWLAMASACSLAHWSGPQPRPMPALPMTPMFGIAAIPAIPSFWGTSPWAMYQGPMVAMMLSYGVPYTVAAPTARASTSAMDAADAACAQWRLVFGSPEGERSLARNVTTPAYWPKYLH